MKVKFQFRKIWHDLFYKYASAPLVEFALKCKNVTSDIDLHQKPDGLMKRFRLRLHLSLCKSCHNYHLLSHALRKASKEKLMKNPIDFERINSQLIKKFAKKKS